MTNLVTDKLRDLAAVLADLKDRVRIALAGELARAVADAVRDVVQTVLQREAVPGRDRSRPSYSYAPPDRWSDPRDPWTEERVDWEGPPDPHPLSGDETGRGCRPRGVTAQVSRFLGPTGSVAVRVARWWADRTGTYGVAVGLGIAVVAAGAYGGPAVQAVLAALAAATDLLAVPDLLAAGAERLGRL
ncbi:MAG TPA: hypothetical protein VGJ05_06160 [Fimbriiglobus sp.]|jgi:hypothetical protein